MKSCFLLILLVLLVNYSEAKECPQVAAAECTETEYNSYIECIRKRLKRSLDCQEQPPCENCEDSCQQCDCNHCAINTCQPICTSCCPNNPPCTTHRCCHKTCHAQCNTSSCRNDCKRTCTEKVNGNGLKENIHNVTAIEGNKVVNITTVGQTRHNITTVINLRNIINNTNVIEIPVQVNNTNVNNITLGGGNFSSDGKNGSSSGLIEPCCHVISPRQCVPKETYPFVRCFHLRRKVCGPLCHAPIVHEQTHEICDQTATGTSCHEQIIYIPQPQPRCAFHPQWPYVSCGAQQQPPVCAGCYLHYTSPFPQMPPAGCSPACYDDGYGMGPYYRQGPFYRPGFAHVPSCYQIGSCGTYGYGGYGGYSPYHGGYSPYYGGYGPYYGSYNYPNFFGGFPNVGYSPNTYENNVLVSTKPNNPNNVRPKTRETKENSSDTNVEVEELPPPSYYSAPVIPSYSAAGYPYPLVPHIPYYSLPPEVDIQASISHAGKASRYAQITIAKDKRNTDADKNVQLEDTVLTNDKEAGSDPIKITLNEKPSEKEADLANTITET